MAAISLINKDRQWFQIQARSPDHRNLTSPVVLCTRDPGAGSRSPRAGCDPRSPFSDNLLVTGAPGIRFYAGGPDHVPKWQALGAIVRN
jgi:hypothetical protein